VKAETSNNQDTLIDHIHHINSNHHIDGTGNTGSWRKKPLEAKGSEVPSKKK
jgi:hypothetical protein